jgi:hypothetical protein
MKRYLLLGLTLWGAIGLDAWADDYVYDVPGAPIENNSRLKIRSTGIILVDELLLEDKQFAYFRLEEVSGNPLIFWLTKDKFAFLGCGGPDSCDDVWRVGSLNQKKQFPIRLKGFTSGQSRPMFHGSYMAYSERLPNGNKGCTVYDWSAEKYVAKWDSGTALDIGIQFGEGASVTCRQITGWIPLENYGGDGPSRRPVYGKIHTQQLSSPKNSK